MNLASLRRFFRFDIRSVYHAAYVVENRPMFKTKITKKKGGEREKGTLIGAICETLSNRPNELV